MSVVRIAPSLAALVALAVPPMLPAGEEPAAEPKQKEVRIAKETTRLMEPLDEAGFVDYVAAVNAMHSKGVTVENNYEVVVRRVVGPGEIGDAAEKYHAALGIPVPPANGSFYANLYAFAGYREMTPEQREAFDAEYDAVLSQPWTSTDHPRAAKWLKAMNGHLDAIAEGTRRPRNYVPYLAGPDEGSPRMVAILLPSVQEQRNLARGLRIRAMHRLGEGDTAGAWSDLQAIHRQARLIDRGFTLIEGLVAIAIDSIACEGDERVLESNPDAALTKRCLADLRALKPLVTMADKIDTGERFMGLDAVQTFAKHGVDEIDEFAGLAGSARSVWGQLLGAMLKGANDTGNASPIDWNVTLEMMNDNYDLLVEAAREMDLDRRAKLFAESEDRLQELQKQAANPAAMLGKVLLGGEPRKAMGRMMGNVLTALLLPAVAQACSAEQRGDARLEVTLTAFALAAHQRATGGYPKSLDALVPKYLTERPSDPFTGEPLHYDRTDRGFSVYSVGMNGVDEQGRGYDDRNETDLDSDDIGVTLP